MTLKVTDADHIYIMAMGPSWSQIPRPDNLPPKSEVWAINTNYRNYPKVHRLFMMHDIRTEILLHDKDFINEVNGLGIPVYTSGDYSFLHNNVPYPIVDIIEEFQVAFFLNSITYAIAFAICQKPKMLHLYGIDMRPDSGFEWHQNEKGCIEFWLGAAVANKIKLVIPKESYVCRRTMIGHFYGFEPRKETNGLIYMVPTNDRRTYDRYKLVPIDRDGNEMDDVLIISPTTKTPEELRAEAEARA